MKENILKNKFEIIIFIIEAICMSLELIASRVLSPYFGNSNIVWTSVIGIILLSSSIGNYIGGKIADKNENERNLKIITIFAAACILVIPIIQENLLKYISVTINDVKIGAIISTIILFFIPSIWLGTIIPIILKIKLNNLDNTGKIAGKIYAISTIGGIFGTFFSGFFLIPNFGSIQILFVLSILLLLLSLTIYKNKIISLLCIATLLIINISLLWFYSNNNIQYGELVLSGDTRC